MLSPAFAIRDSYVSSEQLLGVTISLRNFNAQVGETYAIVKALNKLTGLGMS
jgi:hypothetical protein